MDVSTVTTSDGSLLKSVRETLHDADDAVLCVAFASMSGVHLLSQEFRRLGSRTRLLVTTTFGTTTPSALDAATDAGVRIGTLNPGAGRTYHPKLYLGRCGNRISAVIGSANLTGGLVTNVEAACHMIGDASEPSLDVAWDWAEGLWRNERVRPWAPELVADRSPEQFEPELFGHLQREVGRDCTFFTLGPAPRKNEATELTPSVLYVETDRSRERGTGPQPIPAWMLNLAWDYLRAHGSLSNAYLLDVLHVHRSSAVCAILARMPGVRRKRTRGIVLEWAGGG